MTPKVIHYVWLGRALKPPIVLQCIESWRRFCPGWEIREWGDAAMETVANRYAKEAYAHGKWAFVADWLRLKVLYEHGGFYLDSDMEILKPIDRFLANDLTMGLVNRHGKILFNGGFIGCRPKEDVIGGFLAEYDDIPFVKPDGELDQTPNTVRMVDYFAKRWNVMPQSWTETIEMGNGRKIYPADFFLSKEGYTYHHYCASWLDDWVRKVWLSCGRHKIVRFKRRLDAKSIVPRLLPGEKSLVSFPIGARKRVSLLKFGVKEGA